MDGGCCPGLEQAFRTPGVCGARRRGAGRDAWFGCARIGQIENPLLCRLRDAALKATPTRTQLRQLDQVLRYEEDSGDSEHGQKPQEGRVKPVPTLRGSRRPELQRPEPYAGADSQNRAVPAQGGVGEEDALLLAKPSPTSTLPRVASAATLAAVELGTDTVTAETPVSMLTSASCERVPLKSRS